MVEEVLKIHLPLYMLVEDTNIEAVLASYFFQACIYMNVIMNVDMMSKHK